jgi:hypothetical protein
MPALSRPAAADDYISLGAVARLYQLPLWKVRRLYETGRLAEPPRIGVYRLIRRSDLPIIERALRAAGFLKKGEADAV